MIHVYISFKSVSLLVPNLTHCMLPHNINCAYLWTCPSPMAIAKFNVELYFWPMLLAQVLWPIAYSILQTWVFKLKNTNHEFWLPTPHTLIVWIGCTDNTVVDTGSTKHNSLPSISIHNSLPCKNKYIVLYNVNDYSSRLVTVVLWYQRYTIACKRKLLLWYTNKGIGDGQMGDVEESCLVTLCQGNRI